MPRILKIKSSDPSVDPSHPNSQLPIRGEADVWLRLVRQYGFSKGMKLFGVWMTMAHQHGDVQHILDSRELWDILQALKDCNLAPEYIKPRELNDWTRRWFEAGFDLAMLAGSPTMGQKEKAVN